MDTRVTQSAPTQRDREEDIAQLIGVVEDACRALGGTSPARALTDGSDYDATAWHTLGVDIGLAALGVPEELGGLGGLPELVAVAETVGRHLLPVPLVATVLSTQVLRRCVPSGHDALRAVVNGQAAALVGLDAGSDVSPLTASAGTVSGSSSAVLGGADAELLLAVAGQELYLVDVDAPGCVVTSVHGLDKTRRWSRISLDNAPATLLGEVTVAELTNAVDVAQLVLCAEGLGGAQACLEMTVSYVKERRQFSRPIGSFQAIKHTLADLLVDIEMARSAVDRALRTNSSDARAFAEAVSVAQLWCSATYRQMTAETVQLHGGIGFTWDHDAHLYFRRARSDAALFGGQVHHRARLADLLQWTPAKL